MRILVALLFVPMLAYSFIIIYALAAMSFLFLALACFIRSREQMFCIVSALLVLVRAIVSLAISSSFADSAVIILTTFGCIAGTVLLGKSLAER